MIAGCYSLDLYCRHQDGVYDEDHRLNGQLNYVSYPASYTGATEDDCKKQARRYGWVFNRDGDVTCRLCANK